MELRPGRPWTEAVRRGTPPFLLLCSHHGTAPNHIGHNHGVGSHVFLLLHGHGHGAPAAPTHPSACLLTPWKEGIDCSATKEERKIHSSPWTEAIDLTGSN